VAYNSYNVTGNLTGNLTDNLTGKMTGKQDGDQQIRVMIPLLVEECTAASG